MARTRDLLDNRQAEAGQRFDALLRTVQSLDT
jgi:hypothetical protein